MSSDTNTAAPNERRARTRKEIKQLIEEVISGLVDLKQFRLFLFGGGKNEIEILEKLSSKFDNVTNIAGKVKLKEELNLIFLQNSLSTSIIDYM